MKQKKNSQRNIELMFEIGCLRHMPRSWKRFLNPDTANNTEHTMRVIWLALLIAKYEKPVNEEKILKMALVHDMPESRTGDVDYLSRQYVERKEEKAVSNIFGETIFEKEMPELWHEYEKRASLEAKIVKDADNLDVELELMEQISQGHSMGSIWQTWRQKKVYPRLYTAFAKKFWQEIRQAEPHDWHLKADNRFNEGDWSKKSA
jgi:putative hydrolase of HD superfamily